MTTVRDIAKKCAVCTKTSPQRMLASTSVWGQPDLDLRPSQMQRSSMFAWLDECPHCGYVAADIEKELEASPDMLKSEEYLTCNGNEFKSDLSKRFFRRYLISKAEKNYNSEFYSLLHCAWTCDDADDKLAVKMRRLALESIEKIDAESDDEKSNLKLIRADLLRRSLQFDELVREFGDMSFGNEIMDKVIAFQLELAAKGDSACYTLEDIPKEVTITLGGRLHRKLNMIADVNRVSLTEVMEKLLSDKADEMDSYEKMDKLFE